MVSRLRTVAVLFGFLLLVGTSLSAQHQYASGKDPKGQLATLCLTHPLEPVCQKDIVLTQDEAWLVLRTACGRSTAPPPCDTFIQTRSGMLEVDAVSREWIGSWEQRPLTLEFDVAGVPTLRLQRGEAKPLKIVITNISPLAYSATPGTPKEDDLAIIAGLKTFLPLAGAALSGGLASLTLPPLLVAVAPPAAIVTEKKDFEIKLNNFLREHASADPPPPPPPPPCSIGVPDVAPMMTLIGTRNRELAKLSLAMGKLAKELSALEAHRNRFISVMQRAEHSRVDATDLEPVVLKPLNDAYDGFATDAAVVGTSTASLATCEPMLNAFAALLGSPENVMVARTLATQAGPNGCDDTKLANSVSANAISLTRGMNGTCKTPELEAGLKLYKGALLPLTDRLRNAKEVEKAVWPAMEKLAEAKPAVLRGAAVLTEEIQEARRHTWNGTLIRELIVTRQNPSLPWNKVQTHAIVVKADTPYAKEMTLVHPAEQTYGYKLESMTGNVLGFAISMVYTPLDESTWTAAAGPGGTKVITETKREGRAGALAAFLNYRFTEHRPRQSNKYNVLPTLDVGVGVNADKTAFFLGTGLEIRKAVRIGIGWSPQRLSQLADGQTENVTVVTSNDDIRTVKGFELKNWYVSFAFALDSLSLFNNK